MNVHKKQEQGQSSMVEHRRLSRSVRKNIRSSSYLQIPDNKGAFTTVTESHGLAMRKFVKRCKQLLQLFNLVWIWSLSEYQRVVYIDNDMIIIRDSKEPRI